MHSTKKIYALIDINNCYVSCERVFNPRLNNKAVIVLSNNDGCAVARSQEAKDLGIKMAVPFFQIQDLVHRHQVQVLSSNYALYGEMSRRFMMLLGDFVSPEEQEIYSIDECFLDLTAYAAQYDLTQYAQQIVHRVQTWLGLPVCIGIGRSKTAAKLANHIAKKQTHFQHVCNLLDMDLCAAEQLYQHLTVNEVWGVGRKNAQRLRHLGIHNVLDLAQANPEMIRQQFSVVMQRTVLELRGISCLEIEQIPSNKQQIVASRSFGHGIQQLDELKEALSCYVQDAVSRLREQQLLCGHLIVFAQSSPFKQTQGYYHPSLAYTLPEPTDNILILCKLAMTLLEQLYRPDIEFKKCGVHLLDLTPRHGHCVDLFADPEQQANDQQLMSSLELIQKKFGKNKLALGACRLPQRKWHMAQGHLSPNYFKPGQLLKI